VPQAIHAAAELGIADALALGPATAAQLAARLHTHPDATARLLGALVVLELVVAGPEGYSLTELGAFLRSDSVGSRRAWARLMAGDFVWRAWGKLTECVRTGKAAFAAGDERTSDTIHDWDDDRSLAILRHCRAAMDRRARLVIVEPAAPAEGATVPPSLAWIVAFSDLNMLVNTGGRERTAVEYTALLTRAGLRVVDVRPAGGFYS
jgi:hypothetical protein